MRVSCTIIAALALGCSAELPPQGQVVLHMDTDAPLADPPLFDRVLVEIFPPGSATTCDGCSREIPVDVEKVRAGRFSFGFVPRPRVLGYVARLRLFRSRGRATPRPESTIELVGYLPAVAEEGVITLTARFRTDDVGRPRGTLRAPIRFDEGAPTASAEGTWPPARIEDCTLPAPDGAACVPGGAFFMGDPRVSITDRGIGGAKEHLVVLSPYFLDEREVTVAEIRASGLALVDSRGRGVDPVDDLSEGKLGRCDYTVAPGPWDDHPVNCVSWQLARAYCQKKGGDLPTEAELERVASAGGTRLSPWGDHEPACTEAVVGRESPVSSGGCRTRDFELGSRVVPERAGSGSGDRVDAIVDLGANLSEWARDTFQDDDGACWAAALLFDPVCDDGSTRHASKGGDHLRIPVDYAQTRRLREATDRAFSYNVVGFRCAYRAK